MSSDRPARVQQQLRLYEHPLVEFDARAKGDSGRGDHSATGSAALNLQAQPKVSS